MITGWVLRLVVSLGLAAVVLFEAGSPLIARVQLDGIAADTAREARKTLESAGPGQAEEAAKKFAAEKATELTAFEVTPKRGVVVTVRRIAPSVLLGKWDKTKSYYDVSVEGRSEKGGEL